MNLNGKKEISVFDMFSPAQFSGMMFNVFDLKKGVNVFKLYPAIENWDSVIAYKNRIVVMEIPDKNGKIKKRKVKAPYTDLDRILRYVFFLYDWKSPLINQTKVLSKRKEWAVALAELHKTCSQERVKDITENNDMHVVSIIVEFLTKYQPVKWTMICSYEQQFEEFQNTLMRKTTEVRGDKDLVTTINAKSALLEKSDRIAERLTALYTEVFTDEFASIARTFSKTSPEQRAMLNLKKATVIDV